MKLRFLTTEPSRVDLRPNESKREWMDELDQRFAYRCLPLTIGNAHGWSFYNTQDFEVWWNGTSGKDAIQISSDADTSNLVISHFGSGILTFYVKGIFQTEPGWSLWASGPPNMPKAGISPLTGIIETDWAPYTFTMNWQITTPNRWIKFSKGEPFCSVFPVQRDLLETIEPEILSIDNEPELKEEYLKWSKERDQFSKDLNIKGTKANKQKWQKTYFLGKRPDHSKGADTHKTKLKLKDFKNIDT